MSDMYIFKVPKAKAELSGEGMKLTLTYPDSPERIQKRLPRAPEYGISKMREILEKGSAEIACEQYPIRPASGGVIDVLGNGKIVVHRRDKKAPTNPLHLSIAAGYPNSVDETIGTPVVCMREGGEEHLYVTKSKPHKLIVPSEPIGMIASIKAAQRLGVERVPTVMADVEYIAGPDTLEIRSESKGILARHSGYIGLNWESETALNLIMIRRWDFDAEDMLPLDAETVEICGKSVHLNREIFMLTREELKGKSAGERLENAVAYRAEYRPGLPKPAVQGEPAGAPYIFLPDDNFTRMLYGLDIWRGSWLQAEIDREIAKTAGERQQN